MNIFYKNNGQIPDTTLSDYYGMMASCQDIDDFYDTAKKYFEFCMVSQGVSVGDAQKWSETMGGMLEGTEENINDLMLLSPVEDSLNIEEVNNANLANPVMVKEEIVEFMKYRAPIELLGELQGNSGFVTKLQNVETQIENLPAETTVQKCKFEYYEAENELLIAALKTYRKMTEYEGIKYDGANYIDDVYMAQILKDMKSGAADDAGAEEKGLEENYKELHRKYVTYWANTDGIQPFVSVKTYVSNNGACDVSGELDTSDMSGLISDSETARHNYEVLRDEIQQRIDNSGYKTLAKDVNEVQYWVYMSNVLGDKYQKYKEAQAELRRVKENLAYVPENTKKWTTHDLVGFEYNPFTRQWEPQYEDNDHDAGNETYSGGKSYYQACAEELSNVESLWNARETESIYGISQTLESYSNDIQASGELTSYITEIPGALDKLKSEYGYLVQAQESLETLAGTLGDLRDKLAAYTEALGNWEEAANTYEDCDSDLIQEDLRQLDVINGREEPTEDDLAEGLVRVRLDCGDLSDSDRNNDDIDKFEQRINNIIDLMISYRESIESIRYHGVQIVGTTTNVQVFSGADGISDLNSFAAAAGMTPQDPSKAAVDIDQIPVYQDELDAYIENTFDISDELDSIIEVTDENNPKLHNYDDPEDLEGMEDLDIWLHSKFDMMEVSDEIAEGMLDKLKEKFNNILPDIDEYKEYDNITLSGNTLDDEGSLPSNGAADTAVKVEDAGEDVKDKLNAGTEAGKLFSKINFEELFEGERDRLYTLEYIMKMFTYETSALEGIYNMGRQDVEDDNIYMLNVGEEMKEIAPGTADGVYNNQWNSDEGSWGEERLTFIQNKSMTNKMQNWTNNYLYGSEVEYILYGGNVEGSRDAMAGTLMFTRFGLNMAPVSKHYWKDNTVSRIASEISIATSGVVPMPIVKLVICMGICAAESAVDLRYLKAGLPVIFYKNDPETQLFIMLDINPAELIEDMKAGSEYSGTFLGNNTMRSATNASTDSEENNELTCMSYSDYLRMFLLIGLHTSEENIYKRTADVIQINMSHNSELDGYDSFEMKKALTGFQMNYKVKVEPLLLKIPFARQYGSEEVINSDVWNVISGDMIRKY